MADYAQHLRRHKPLIQPAACLALRTVLFFKLVSPPSNGSYLSHASGPLPWLLLLSACFCLLLPLASTTDAYNSSDSLLVVSLCLFFCLRSWLLVSIDVLGSPALAVYVQGQQQPHATGLPSLLLSLAGFYLLLALMSSTTDYD
jgi:hypothetical protein